ncbi:LOW QUALITY PROTEIN: glycoside hydrolase family 92 protein [Colletotrichum tofieldiae]|nr:LOW QUALITY PROTEIN: glycoside hydrolase family 92 protein [Colletotrichum tofieldiae]GKT94278.1 LOW QUALITY PROTEIN: glycoside hydrolase family 92 protein [Colletotrichum tofieldiae]
MKSQKEAQQLANLGYLADHRDIELLKLRNFTISKKIDDRIFTEEDAQDKVCEVIAAMHPFITFLNSVVMPDLNLDEEDDSEDEDENDQENGDAEENGNPEDTGDEEEEEGKDWSTHKF